MRSVIEDEILRANRFGDEVENLVEACSVGLRRR